MRSHGHADVIAAQNILSAGLPPLPVEEPSGSVESGTTPNRFRLPRSRAALKGIPAL
jgi:transposase